MAEEQINNVNPVATEATTQTQPAAPVEENTANVQATEKPTEQGVVDNQPKATSEPAVETPQAEDITNKVVDTPNAQEDINALKKRLEEYELRDEEVKQLSERLGTNRVADTQMLEAHKQLDIIDNQAQQEYIRLCNQFGVDYRPEKIEASANELKAKDPQAFYELQNRIEKLDASVNQKRSEVNNFITQREISLALNKHQQLLQASPVLSQQLNTYLHSVPLTNATEQIDGFMEMAMAVQREAFEYGKIYAQQQAMQQKADPNTVLNGSTMATNQTYSAQQPRVFTRQEIANMSQEEFEKYEKEIDLAVKEGRIR